MNRIHTPTLCEFTMNPLLVFQERWPRGPITSRGTVAFSGTFLCILLAMFSPLRAGEQPVTLVLEAEDFHSRGDWSVVADRSGHSGGGFLFAGPSGAARPAATTIVLARAGRYQLWVRSLDFPTYRPGTRLLTVSVHGRRSKEVFGDSGKEGWTWEPGGVFDLPAGEIPLSIHDVSNGYGRIDTLLLTTGAVEWEPAGVEASDPLAARSVQPVVGRPAATLENELVRYAFLPATCEGRETIMPRVEFRHGDRWLAADLDPTAEVYSVVKTGEIEIHYEGTFPLWTRSQADAIEVKAGRVILPTVRSTCPPEIWRAGEFFRFQPAGAKRVGEAVRIHFEPSPAGELVSEWHLAPGRRAVNVKLFFTPSEAGSYSLGYHLYFRRPLDDVEELQLPLAFQRRRFPDTAYTVLDPRMPTPLSMAQTGKADQAISWAVIGDPAEIPFAWPDRRKPNMGFCIRDEAGHVQPAIYGPVPGTERAQIKAGQTLTFQFNVLVQPGEWYGAYRTAADEVFGLHDYRRNGRVSLSDAVMNMIDLIKDDEFGGWWERAKGWYQIESRNTVTHSTPATMLSLYRLTGDRDLYRRRVLPTLQYVLSRDSVHFTPEPRDPGRYRTGPMGGPVRHFGSSTFTALSRLTSGYTPAFQKIALPAEDKVRPTVGYSHAELFNEWAARYRMTDDPVDLQQAIDLADTYLKENVLDPPTRPIGYTPFWLISFVPDWEGLLMMYELTGEKRFFEGAVIGARQLMAGLWTQPVFPEGQTTIFPGGRYEGDPWNGRLLARGPDETRLGFPLQEDSLREHQAPAWLVSCVGLGFEQPSTLGAARNRLIYQAVWAPEFLRLARYTGDKAFETCARNATVGRWGNYPGYYVAGHMDLVQDPAYPLVGPDQSTIYYHHIVPHLSWTIDYLVAEVELLSGGQIEFPWLRENGYAFFDGKVFGYAPGRIFDENGCWLWLKRGAIVVDNVQINALTAHNEKKFLAILTNQDTRKQKTNISLSRQVLGIDPKTTESITVRSVHGTRQVRLKNETAALTFKPRELLVVEVNDVGIEVASHRTQATLGSGVIPTAVETQAGEMAVKAVAIAVAPGPWDAFIWCVADEEQVRNVVLETHVNGMWTSQTDNDYPFEFNIPMAASEETLQFRIVCENVSGETFSTGNLMLGAAQPVPSR